MFPTPPHTHHPRRPPQPASGKSFCQSRITQSSSSASPFSQNRLAGVVFGLDIHKVAVENHVIVGQGDAKFSGLDGAQHGHGLAGHLTSH